MFLARMFLIWLSDGVTASFRPVLGLYLRVIVEQKMHSLEPPVRKREV